MVCFYSKFESALNGRLLNYLVMCSLCLFPKLTFCGGFSPRTVGTSKSITVYKSAAFKELEFNLGVLVWCYLKEQRDEILYLKVD